MKDSDKENEGSATQDPRPLKHLIILAILLCGLVGVSWLTGGWIVVEKLLTSLAMPVGVIWIALLIVVYFSVIYRARFLGLLTLLSWLLLTIAGNGLVANRLIHSLEKDFIDLRPLEGEPFDVVIVSGGGASFPLTEQPQLGISGDRIGLAAEMYHAGKAKKIICTGSKIESLSVLGVPDEGDLAKAILQRLGVPESEIETATGRNTREEMSKMAERFADQPATRVGLLTSAWHLPRVLRLAAAADLRAQPIPADYSSHEVKPTVLSIIPGASALQTTTIALKEYLARFAGQ